MQFPESWLREFCNPALDTHALAQSLTMAGLEVEDVRPVAPPFTSVVVGLIRRADPHPNADRLRVCEVDVGEAVPLSIVCGAPNARAGIKVPCARVGAQLPPVGDGDAKGAPFEIKLSKLRSVESQGMLCSARELRLSEDHGGLLELAGDAPVGANVRDVLKLDDHVFTLKLTPNLGHALGVFGIARELSAITGAPLVRPEIAPVPAGHGDILPVRVSAPDLCGRFSGRIVRGVNAQAPSPAWLVDRLARCGQRSVSALVDISNYVMFEYGRPTHIFDLDKIHGGLEVRWGRVGESLKLLNGNTIELDERVGVIADEQAVESLAGIMGGDATAVGDTTTNIYVEAAFWWPEAVAGRSRRFNFSTDAGHRFERGVDPSLTDLHIERITRLIQQVCGGVAGPMDDHQPNMPPARQVTLRVARAARVIGMPLTQAQCEDALRRLELPVQASDGVLTVTAPAHRFDLNIEEDLIEEVARLIGYDRLPDTMPIAPVLARVPSENRRGPFAVRHRLAGLGFQETINFSFVEESWERDLHGNSDPIRLLNPIASQLAVMRTSLLGSLLQVLKYNHDRKADRVRVFELGRVFRRHAQMPGDDATVAGVDQPMHVAALAWGPVAPLDWSAGKSRPVDFFDLKGDLEALLAPQQALFEPGGHPAFHPGRQAQVIVQGRVVGHVGELHPRWAQSWGFAQAPVLFEMELDAVMQRSLPTLQPVGRLHPVERDLAVIVAERWTHAEVMAAIESAPHGGLLARAVLFDVFRPKAGQVASGIEPGEKSLAVRLYLDGGAATLTDAQIDAAVGAVVQALGQRCAARLRA